MGIYLCSQNIIQNEDILRKNSEKIDLLILVGAVCYFCLVLAGKEQKFIQTKHDRSFMGACRW